MVKDPLLLPYTFIPSTSIVLPPTTPQRCEPMILKMWVKSKFVLCKPRYYNSFTEKNVFTFLKYSLFRRRYCQCQEILFKHHL